MSHKGACVFALETCAAPHPPPLLLIKPTNSHGRWGDNGRSAHGAAAAAMNLHRNQVAIEMHWKVPLMLLMPQSANAATWADGSGYTVYTAAAHGARCCNNTKPYSMMQAHAG